MNGKLKNKQKMVSSRLLVNVKPKRLTSIRLKPVKSVLGVFGIHKVCAMREREGRRKKVEEEHPTAHILV